MLTLYHTSDCEIKDPDIHYGRKNADFGPGFYLTPDKDFTYRWAGKNAVVNIYELDESGLDMHTFIRDAEWFEYIFNNRRLKDALSSDVIVGPIANDTLFDTLGIISSGYLSTEEALKLLKIGPEFIQVVIKTDKAVAKLRFLRSERIEKIDPSAMKAEQEAFLEAFAKELENIS